MTTRDDPKDPTPDATLPLPTGLAYGIAGLYVVAVVVLLVAIGRSPTTWGAALTDHQLHNIDLAALLGVLILRRRPGHVIGWVLVGVGAFEAADLLGRVPKYLAPSAGPAIDDRNGFWVLGAFFLVIALPQLFPDGRLLGRRWRPLLWFGAAASVLLTVVFFALPTGRDEFPWPFAVAFPAFGLAAVTSLVPLALRFRRSRGVERQQFKWVFAGLAVSGPMLLLGALQVTGGQTTANSALTLVALEIIPVAVTVAVLRYRLYDVDVVISRTLLVAGLAGFITVAYVAIVVGIGSLVGGGERANLPLSLAATAVVAVAFQPVRRALDRAANRLVYGHRATPYDVLSGFATRIGAAEPSPHTLSRLAELMADGTGADPARVWLRVGAELRPAATWPQRPDPAPEPVDTAATTMLPDADLARPVRDRGELLGVLTIVKPRGERATEADTELVGRLAAASGVVLRNLRLDAELAQRLDDLEASRRRLVTAQDEARQRIEADLGGGSRAELVALRSELAGLVGLISAADPDATPKTAALLGRLVEQTDRAVATLDGLAAGVYPPRLAADGLAAALAEQAGRAAVPVRVHADGVGRHPQPVEAAVYFSVLEALQNVAKYAGAGSVDVSLDDGADRLRFTVTDDGAGFDPAVTGHGSGLAGMADRLDTVGGTMTVRSAPGAGTTVSGEVPTGAGAAAGAPEPPSWGVPAPVDAGLVGTAR